MARRFALVVGNAAYAHAGELANPRNDATAVAEVLKELDFKVALGTDLRIQEMEDVLNRFEGDIYDSDTALFFFAGHGIQVKGQNYLIPVDAEIKQEIHLRRRTFSLTKILGTMEQNAKNTLIFLDACRDNPFTRSYLANVRDEERARSLVRSGLAGITLEANRSSFIAYATSPDTVAFDGTGLHSPFTEGLLAHIRAPNISISDMMIEVRKSVLRATNNRQRPWDQSALQERFCFKLADAEANLPHAEDKPTQPKSNLSDEGVLNAVALEHWRAIKGAADPRRLRAFLAQFGVAKVSWLVRDRLEELEAAAWSRLPANRTVDALRAFLADYPDGINARAATAELTALLTASEKTHQVDTLAEAEIDAQQPKPESAQPTQTPAREEKRLEAEAERLAKEKRREAEAERLAEEKRREAEAERLAEEKRRQAEAERLAKAEAEGLAQEKRRREVEAERLAKAEAQRLAKEKRREAEAERLREDTRRDVEAQRLAKDRREAEARRLSEENRREAQSPHAAALEQAADKGDAKAMTDLGVLYQNGQGVTQDYAKAREWYEKAASKEKTGSMVLLGALYRDGQGGARDDAKAREWFEKAAANENTNAMVLLGRLYRDGQGVARDYAKAREWFEKAAAKGNAVPRQP
jgi:TPR repeat protein